MPEVVIIGAGLTGLSAAYHLEQQNFFDYEIFEKNSRPGGLLQSEEQDGFTFDYTGHFLHIKNNAFYTFLTTIAHPDDYIHVTRNSAIYTNNTFIPYPFQMNLYGLPPQIICACIEGFINRPKCNRNINSFHDWVIAHFGKGLGQYFFFPYNSKLLSWPVTKMHHSWTGRFVPNTNLHAMLYHALEKPSTTNVGYNSSFLYPKNDGIAFIIKKITTQLTKKIHLNHEAIAIDQQKKVITFSNGKSTTYQKLITTAPLKETLKNIADTSLKKLSSKLYCTSVLNFNIGFSRTEIGPYHWLYFPENMYDFYRIGFWHNISPRLVKPSHSAIYGEFSYQSTKTNPEQLQHKITKTHQQTLEFLQLTNKDIVTQKILHLPYAYVIYDTWRQKNITAILHTLEKQSIISTGRFGKWEYASMEEAFFDGMQAANAILNITNKKIYPARTLPTAYQQSDTVYKNQKGEYRDGKRTIKNVLSQ